MSLVSVSVLIRVFTFELQSEYDADVPRVFCYLCTNSFGVYETAALKFARHYLFMLTAFCVEINIVVFMSAGNEKYYDIFACLS